MKKTGTRGMRDTVCAALLLLCAAGSFLPAAVLEVRLPLLDYKIAFGAHKLPGLCLDGTLGQWFNAVRSGVAQDVFIRCTGLLAANTVLWILVLAAALLKLGQLRFGKPTEKTVMLFTAAALGASIGVLIFVIAAKAAATAYPFAQITIREGVVLPLLLLSAFLLQRPFRKKTDAARKEVTPDA